MPTLLRAVKWLSEIVMSRKDIMEDLKRIKISEKAIPVRGNDIDTDRIIPARFLKCVTFDGLGEHAFEDDRKGLAAKGEVHTFDQPQYAGAGILLANKNFGCGSSREHAPQSLMRWGLRAIIGESFAEIFYGNCCTLGIPAVVVDEATATKLQGMVISNPDAEFTLDLETKTVSVNGESFPVQIADGPRKGFLEGRWDSTAELLSVADDIKAQAKSLPYFSWA